MNLALAEIMEKYKTFDEQYYAILRGIRIARMGKNEHMESYWNKLKQGLKEEKLKMMTEEEYENKIYELIREHREMMERVSELYHKNSNYTDRVHKSYLQGDKVNRIVYSYNRNDILEIDFNEKVVRITTLFWDYPQEDFPIEIVVELLRQYKRYLIGDEFRHYHYTLKDFYGYSAYAFTESELKRCNVTKSI